MQIRRIFKKTKTEKSRTKKFVLWFKETGIKDIALVGGKNASLGEMYSQLRKKGIRIPDGFSVTAEAYRYFISQNSLDGEIKTILKGLDTGNMRNLAERGYRVREAILSAEFPMDLRNEIVEAYSKLSKEYSPRKSFRITWDKKDHTNHFAGGVDVAVRVPQRPKIWRTRPLPVSRNHISMSPANISFSNPSKNVFLLFLPIGRFPTAWIRVLTTSRSRFRSECKKWCVLTKRRAV